MYLFGAGKGQSFEPTAAAILIQREGSQMRLVWSLGALQSSDVVTGPFNNVTNATSPFLVTPSTRLQFYRLKIR